MSNRIGRGRPNKPTFVTSWGETVDGAYRGKDGKLRPIGQSKPTFSLTDERIAVNKFRRWQKLNGNGPALEPLDDAMDDISWRVHAEHERIRNLLLSDPPAAALDLRIPHVAFYPAMPETPSVTLTEVQTQYCDNKRNSHGERLKEKYRDNLKTWWTEFLNLVGNPRYARDLTSAMIETYHREIMKRYDDGMSATYVRSRFAAVNAIMQFGIDFTEDRIEFRRALDCCGRLTAPADVDNPRPMSPEIFKRLYQVAKPVYQAILLIGANTASHAGDCMFRWSEIDLEARTYAGRRSKNKRPRVAMLWTETVDAIRAYVGNRKPTGEYLFYSTQGNAITGHRIQQQIIEMRGKAGLPAEITFEGIRDAAYGAAQIVDPHHAKFVTGHKTGMADKYVLRAATNVKVAECCEAIREYFQIAKLNDE